MAEYNEKPSAVSKAPPLARIKKPRGPLRSIRINRATNGFIVECEYEQRRSSGKGDCPSPCYEPPAQKVFESARDVVMFVASALKE